MLFQVKNMSCQHCVNAITRALHALDANAQVRVDLDQGRVEAHGRFDAAAAIAALAQEGYPAMLLAPDRGA